MTKNDIIVHCNKFPNVGVYHANFPNLKGPRVPSQNRNKIPIRNKLACLDVVTHQVHDVGTAVGYFNFLQAGKFFINSDVH